MAGEVRGRVKGVVGGGQTGYGERKRRSRRRKAAEVMRGVRQVVFWRKRGRVVAVIRKEKQYMRNNIYIREAYELIAVNVQVFVVRETIFNHVNIINKTFVNTMLAKIIRTLVFSAAKKNILSQLFLSFAGVCQSEISVYISKHSFCH